jgi:hypothetical protein
LADASWCVRQPAAAEDALHWWVSEYMALSPAQRRTAEQQPAGRVSRRVCSCTSTHMHKPLAHYPMLPCTTLAHVSIHMIWPSELTTTSP